ncbi:hypothetical protein PWT90_07788 [Aphanocladium album]|nr:hypothetical protein PWT90_07788 [Aphanocladium album]
MNTEELLVDGGAERQVAERLDARIVNGHIGIMDFEGPEVEDTFDAEEAAVDIVAQEEILRRRRIAAHFEELDQVVKLAMDVSADGDGRIKLQQGAFGVQQLRARVYDEEGLLVGEPALPEEMVF